jgi:hypothetical protein
MKPGIILGLATAVPAFFVLLVPMGEPKSAVAALVTGTVLAVACELSSPPRLKLTWAKSRVVVLWWTVVGILVGIAEAFAAGSFIDGGGPDNLYAAMVAPTFRRYRRRESHFSRVVGSWSTDTRRGVSPGVLVRFSVRV